jgi:NADH-quinone oxidoreductase subunit H
MPDRKVPAQKRVEVASDYPVPPLDLAVPTRSRHKLRRRDVEAGEPREPVLTGGDSRKESE